jgi:hypothetical protein
MNNIKKYATIATVVLGTLGAGYLGYNLGYNVGKEKGVQEGYTKGCKDSEILYIFWRNEGSQTIRVGTHKGQSSFVLFDAHTIKEYCPDTIETMITVKCFPDTISSQIHASINAHYIRNEDIKDRMKIEYINYEEYVRDLIRAGMTERNYKPIIIN